MYEGTIFFGRQGAVIQAMSGVEIALWDIVGKATRPAGLPAARRRLSQDSSAPTPRSSSATRRPRPSASASSWPAQGYRAVKFGWGPMGQSEESDIAHVRAARKGIGDQTSS